MTERRLPHGVAAAGAARSEMRADLISHGVPPGPRGDAELVLGELVANAVQHGRPDDEGMIHVSWSLGDGALRVSVRDSGSIDALEAPEAPAPLALHGRGLTLVEALSEQWSYDGRDGTRVSADLSLPRGDLPRDAGPGSA